MIIVALIVTALIIATVWWYIEYYRHFNGVWAIPSSKFMFPFFGHMFLVTSVQELYWDMHKLTMTIGKGKSFRGCMGFFYVINIIDPVILESLLSNTAVINKSQFYGYLHRWLGTGLLTSNLEKWRGRRKLLTPAYHFKILEQFIDVFDKNAKILVKKLSSEVGQEKTDVFPYVTLCALDIICETTMGTSVNAQECADSEYVQAIKTLSDGVLKRGTSLFKQWEFYYKFTQDYRDEVRNLKIVHSYTMSVIKARRADLLYERNLPIAKMDDGVGCRAKSPFLDVLLQATFNGTPLSDEDIREEVDTFMFEGHDTTSSAISFCIYSISKHPLIQARLLEEQRAIFGTDPDRVSTYQDLQEMKYLEMVIKETLRLYPSVPAFGRVITEDFTYDQYHFKKGTELFVFVYSLHRNPENFPNPDVFDPERFTPVEQAKRHPFSYLPFSAGFRNCIGQKFAMMEMKVTLSTLVRKFVLHEIADSKVKLKSGLILTSVNGTNVRLTHRFW